MKILTCCLLLSVVIFTNASVLESIKEYFDSQTVKAFSDTWKKYRTPIENALERILIETYGEPGMNVYVRKSTDGLRLSKGFFTYDNVVQVLFKDLYLTEYPRLKTAEVSLDLPSNLLTVSAIVSKMLIVTDYVMFRNQSDVVYASRLDATNSSPFSLPQVNNDGDATIVAEGCILSGYAITALLTDETISLNHDTFRLNNCKFSVEISSPGAGAPPVIEPYFSRDQGTSLELLMTKVVLEELKPKLQGAVISYVNTSAIFGADLTKIRKDQESIFRKTTKFTSHVAKHLNKRVVNDNGGIVNLDEEKFSWTGQNGEYSSVEISNLSISGLDSAYSPPTGGPIKKTTVSIVGPIQFYGLQVKGLITLARENAAVILMGFYGEIQDVTLYTSMLLKSSGKENECTFINWRYFDLHTSDLPSIASDALVTGYLLNKLPKLIVEQVYSSFSERVQEVDGEGRNNDVPDYECAIDAENVDGGNDKDENATDKNDINDNVDNENDNNENDNNEHENNYNENKDNENNDNENNDNENNQNENKEKETNENDNNENENNDYKNNENENNENENNENENNENEYNENENNENVNNEYENNEYENNENENNENENNENENNENENNDNDNNENVDDGNVDDGNENAENENNENVNVENDNNANIPSPNGDGGQHWFNEPMFKDITQEEPNADNVDKEPADEKIIQDKNNDDGNENAENENNGSINVENENNGNDNVKNDNVGNDNVGNDNVGDDNVGNDNVGNDSVGNDNVGNDNNENVNVANHNDANNHSPNGFGGPPWENEPMFKDITQEEPNADNTYKEPADEKIIQDENNDDRNINAESENNGNVNGENDNNGNVSVENNNNGNVNVEDDNNANIPSPNGDGGQHWFNEPMFKDITQDEPNADIADKEPADEKIIQDENNENRRSEQLTKISKAKRVRANRVHMSDNELHSE